MKHFIAVRKVELISLCIMAGVFFTVVYLLGSNVLAENGQASKGVVIKTDDKKDSEANSANNAKIVPTGADFIKVTEKCAKCHQKQFSSLDNLKKIKWIVPGKPELSPVCKIIGKNKKPNGTYHNLSDSEKATLNDYVKSLN